MTMRKTPTFTRLQLLEFLASIDEESEGKSRCHGFMRSVVYFDVPDASQVQDSSLRRTSDCEIRIPRRKGFGVKRQDERNNQSKVQVVGSRAGFWSPVKTGEKTTLIITPVRLKEEDSPRLYCSIKIRHVDVVKKVLQGSCQ